MYKSSLDEKLATLLSLPASIKEGECMVIGLRMSEKVNRFDDYVGLYTKYGGELTFRLYPATTKPGTHWLLNPMNKRGTACMIPGKYPNMWKFGKHQGKYEALVQNSPISLYMDSNKDSNLDLKNVVKFGVSVGINLHKASNNWVSTARNELLKLSVGAWSAGCQVIASSKHFDMFMWFAKRHIETGNGNMFDYVLYGTGETKNIKTLLLGDNGAIKQLD